MKCTLLTLACIQLLLVVNTQSKNCNSAGQANTYHKTLTSEEPDTASTYRPCGLNQICVPRHVCNKDNLEVNKYGRKLLDIRMDSTRVCPYLEYCCHIEDKRDDLIILKPQAIATEQPPATQPNPQSISTGSLPVSKPKPTNSFPNGCGYRNKGGLYYQTQCATHNEAQYAEFPWMVAIIHKVDGRRKYNICGGSIITPTIVLTAAHCVDNKAPNKLIVRAGEWDMQTKSEPLPHQDRAVSELITHEFFNNRTLVFDVALLKVAEPFVLADNVKPVCLPSVEQDFDDTRCFVAGWGKHKFGSGGVYQQLLKKIELPMVEPQTCEYQLQQTHLGKNFELDESFICAGGEEGTDACTGDGGSPLVCHIPGSNERYFQAGIVAWGIGCASKDVPGVYANMMYLLPWVNEKLSRLYDGKYFIF